jgi:hypothetical protein
LPEQPTSTELPPDPAPADPIPTQPTVSSASGMQASLLLALIFML